MSNKELLIDLVKRNPDLPVIPMVTSDVVVPFNGYWPCRLGPAYIAEYIKYHDEIFIRKNGGIPMELIDSFLSWEPHISIKEIESKIHDMWIKGILVHIDEENER